MSDTLDWLDTSPPNLMVLNDAIEVIDPNGL